MSFVWWPHTHYTGSSLADKLINSDGIDLDKDEIRLYSAYFTKSVHLRKGKTETVVGKDATYKVDFYIDSWRSRLDVYRTANGKTEKKRIVLPVDTFMDTKGVEVTTLLEYDDNKVTLKIGKIDTHPISTFLLSPLLAVLFSFDLARLSTAEVTISEVEHEDRYLKLSTGYVIKI